MATLDAFAVRWIEGLWTISWQVAVLVVLIGAISLLAARARPTFRYGLWLVVLLRLCLPTGLFFPMGLAHHADRFGLRVISAVVTDTSGLVVHGPSSPTHDLQASGDSRHNTASSQANVPSPTPSSRVGTQAPVLSLSLCLSLTWLGSVLTLSALVCWRTVRLGRYLKACPPVERQELLAIFERQRCACGVKRAVGLRYMDLPNGHGGPVATGFLHPQILLPRHMVESWPIEDIEPILLHEFAHIERLDLAVNWVQTMVQVVYFFHPLVWYANWRIRQERERICDDLAILRVGHRRKEYCQSILRVIEEARNSRTWAFSAVGLSERQGSIGGRILRLMDRRYRLHRPLRAFSLGLIAILGMACLLLASGASEKGGQTMGNDKSSPQAAGANDAVMVHCVDKQGQPVADAEVYLVQMTGSVGGMYNESDMRSVAAGPLPTDANGMVRFPNPAELKDGGWFRTAYARLPGKKVGAGQSMKFGPNALNVDGPLEIVLVDSTTVHGKVSVPAGFDPAAVRVRVLSLMIRDGKSQYGAMFERIQPGTEDLWPAIFERHSGPDGSFVLADVPTEGNLYLAADCAGLGQAQYMGVDPSLSGPVEIALTMAREGSIEGTVTGAPAGPPVSRIKLTARREDGVSVRLSFEATTDAQGHYRIAGLEEGSYVVRMTAGPDWTASVRDKIRVQSGQTVPGVDFKLERGAVVTGLVTDAVTSAPVAGVGVAAVSGDVGGEGLGSAQTGADGRFRLRLPSGTAMLYVSNIPENYVYPAQQARQTLNILPGEAARENVNFRLNPKAAPEAEKPGEMATAKGRVLDPNGKPLAGVQISCNVEYKAGEDVRQEGGGTLGYTDKDGNYAVKTRPDAKCKIVVGGGQVSSATSKEFNTRSGSMHEIENLTVRPATGRGIAGVVVDPDGHPIPGVAVTASSDHMWSNWNPNEPKTDSEGRFKCGPVLENEFLTVVAVKSGYPLRNWNGVSPDRQDLRLVLSPSDDPAYFGSEQVPKADTMLDKPAPDWDVSFWVQKASESPQPKRTDAKRTVLMFSFCYADWPTVIDDLERFEKTCSAANAVPVVIFSAATHESIAQEAIRKHGLKMSIGMDRFVPKSRFTMSSATMIAYGFGRMPLIYVIDPEGVIRHIQSGLSGLDQYLGAPADVGIAPSK